MLDDLRDVSPQKDTVVTIGVFDGVHLGHQALFQRVRDEARARGLLSAVVTFRNHPRTVLTPGFQPRYLTDLEDRLQIIRSLKIDLVVGITFTKEVSQLRAREFVSLLKDHLRMKVLLAGPDFALGKNREGDVPTLTGLGKELGFSTIPVHLIEEGGQAISSTAIREALAQGDVARVGRLLGRPYTLSGPIVVGDKRGHLLGFPTANLAPNEERALPADGVYATRAWIFESPQDSIAYIGMKPTFQGVKRATEVYIFDFQGDLYGQQMSVDFVAQIRGDIRFSGPQQLIDQMTLDVARAREVLA